MERYPALESYEYDRMAKTLTLNFYRSSPMALYTPLVHDLETDDVIRYATQKNDGYDFIEDYKIRYSDGTINPFKNPKKVLSSKAYLELPNAVRVYPLSQEYSLSDELFSQLVTP